MLHFLFVEYGQWVFDVSVDKFDGDEYVVVFVVVCALVGIAENDLSDLVHVLLQLLLLLVQDALPTYLQFRRLPFLFKGIHHWTQLQIGEMKTFVRRLTWFQQRYIFSICVYVVLGLIYPEAVFKIYNLKPLPLWGD